MLSGISSSNYKPKGKRSSSTALEMRRHQYSIGIKEWERPIGSVSKFSFTGEQGQQNRFKPPHPSTSQVDIPHEHDISRAKRQSHFTTETTKQYQKYFNPERRHPHLKSEDISQSKRVQQSLNYGFGYDQSMRPSTHFYHSDFSSIKPVQDVKWKDQRERFNPITNQVYNNPTLSAASQFDFYNHLKPKGRVTNNISAIPRTRKRVDIITGRELPSFQ